MSNTGSDTAVFCVVDIPFGGIVSAAPAGFAAVIGLPAVWQSVAVDEIAAPAPGTKTLIFYPGLTAALHNALAGGTPPEAALANWQAMAEALLTFYRRRRMTAFLAEVGTLVQDPAGLRARLAGWAGPLPDTLLPDPGLSGADNANDETADLARIMTATVLLASRELRRLNDELGAGGFALRPPALDTGAPLQAMAGLWGRLGTATAATKVLETQASTLTQQAERDAAAAQALRDSLQDREGRILALNRDLQAREGRILALNRDLQAREAEHDRRVAELESGLAQLQAEQAVGQTEQQTLRDSLQDREGRILALNRDLQAREAEMESGLAQLQAEQAASQAEQQTERAMLTSKVADLQRQTGERDQKLAAQRIEIELMQAEIARFYNSLSWKVTAPMRAIRRGFDSLRNHKG